MSATDKGMYKLVARNEKGEATSQVVEVTEIPDQGEKPKIVTGLKSIVSIYTYEIFYVTFPVLHEKKRENIIFTNIYFYE